MTLPQSDRQSGPFTLSADQVGPHPFAWWLPHADDLTVLRFRNGVETTLAYGADYTIAGVGNPAGGSITLTAALAGDQIFLCGKKEIVRGANFSPGWSTTPDLLNAEGDRVYVHLQELKRDVDRSLRTSAFDDTAYDAASRRITGIADPIDDRDAATKGWMVGFAGDAVAAAEAAAGSAEVAVDAAAAAEAAAAAVDAATSDLTSFSSRALALVFSPTVAPPSISLRGYHSPGDGGGATYTKALSEPAHPGKFSITLADGVTIAWYEIQKGPLNARMFGAKGDGATNDQPAFGGALQTIHARYGGRLEITDGLYLLNGAASPDSYANGLVVPMRGFSADFGVSIEGRGRAVLRAGSNNMVIARLCQPGSTIKGVEIDGNGMTGVIGVGMIAGDRTQTTTLVSQSECNAFECYIHHCAEGVVIEPGPTVGGAQSGAFYCRVLSCNLDQNTVGIVGRESPHDPTNRPTRGNVSFNRIVRGNCGIDLLYTTEFTMVGNNFEFLKNTYSATPYAQGCAVHVGAKSEGNWLIAGAAEACDYGIFNQGTLPNAIIIRDFPTGGVNSGLTFSPDTQPHSIRLTRRTAAYETLRLEGHHAGYAGLVIDKNAANVRDISLRTNGVDRLTAGSAGQIDLIGSLGNMSMLNTGATLTFNRPGAVSINATGAGSSLNFGANGGTPLSIFAAEVSAGNNLVALGHSSRPFKDMFSQNAPTVVSDQREKTPLRAFSEDEMRVGARLMRLPGVFRWLKSVSEKGPDHARQHVGVIAQDVIECFRLEGLDAFAYGAVGRDVWADQYEPVLDLVKVALWDDETGAPMIDPETNQVQYDEQWHETGEMTLVRLAGERFSIRPEQLFWLITAASQAQHDRHEQIAYHQQQLIERLAARLNALEGAQ